jgi:UDP-N-acetylglucosamine 2-epimerase (non-hydrolysing)
MKTHKLICVAGARPNFMKVAPLLTLLRRDRHFTAVLVHTGQHYDDELSGQFFRDLELPAPDHHLCVGSGSHAQQTAEVMKRFEPVVTAERADCVVVVGDVNSTMAAAVVAVKLQVPVFHVEAGLRSFDRSMPEEINRLVTDAISDVLLVTEESGRRNLLNEGIPETRIHEVGNLMIDSLRQRVAAARQSDILGRLCLIGRPFGLVTLHRPSNVDHTEQLNEILGALAEISQEVPLIFPVHPRTRSHLDRMQFVRSANVTILNPLGYLDFLCLMSHSSVVLTDSGGVQEETTALGVPCLTLRDNTERPVTIEQGTNTLAGTRRSTILAAWNKMRERPKAGRIPPLWDGIAAERCLKVIRNYFAEVHCQTSLDGLSKYGAWDGPNPCSARHSGSGDTGVDPLLEADVAVGRPNRGLY